jgi:hypothetical protein
MAYLIGCIVTLIFVELVHSIWEHHRDNVGKRPWGPP